jgi:UDP-N-acetylmuramoyl-tripeptide--D-alanyl-D-alanine ligase
VGVSAPVLTVDDLDLRLDGTTLWFVAEGSRHEVALDSIGEASALEALDRIAAALGDGTPLPEAVSAAVAVAPLPNHMQRFDLAGGTTILNDAHGADRNDMAAALRTLVQVTPPGRRSLAVLGQFDSDPADFVEAHDAIGRLVVRLNVAKLVAVGDGARHLQSAAGLEGSWDGESVLVGTPEEAYDLLRDEIRGNDVVLVKGGSTTGLAALGERLAAAGVAKW